MLFSFFQKDLILCRKNFFQKNQCKNKKWVFFRNIFSQRSGKLFEKLEQEKELNLDYMTNLANEEMISRVHHEKIGFYVKKIEDEKKILYSTLENTRLVLIFFK